MIYDNLQKFNDHGIVAVKSKYSFDETVERLKSAFTAHGIKIFISINQQTEAAAIGMQMPPTMLIVFGNPKGGTPIMLAQPLSGLDLPLKVLISEAMPGEVIVCFNSTQYLLQRYELPEQLSKNIAGAEELITNTLII